MEYLAAYLILFTICLLTVARIIPYQIPLVLVLIYMLLRNRENISRVDYSLLATFIALFIFIGNLGRIPQFSSFLERIMAGRETLTAVLASQIMSNVPAALLLSGFTDNYRSLIVGTNIGGLGTLIASMASLISFKYIAKENRNLRGKYLGIFTASNIIFMSIHVNISIFFLDKGFPGITKAIPQFFLRKKILRGTLPSWKKSRRRNKYIFGANTKIINLYTTLQLSNCLINIVFSTFLF